ncbi:MAG: hypothetical protein ACYDC1_14050, partial [Limisphaerales bacterium]
PPPPEPPTGPAPPAAPTGASITSWTRLEPSCRDADLSSTTSARVFDPLWLLSRQWQMGEFQAEDAGTPVRARVRATVAPISRCHLGALPAESQLRAAAYDVRQMPLEALVERRRLRAATDDEARALPLAVDAGAHFLRWLEQQPLQGDHRQAFVARFALALPAEPTLDDASRRFARTMAGRVLDARRLAMALRADGADGVANDAALQIDAGDVAEVVQTLRRWLAWYDALAAEPASGADDAWVPERLEYEVALAARLSERPEDEVVLAATEFDDGRLDWSRFDVDLEVRLGTDDDRRATKLDVSAVPAPVTLRGVPAPRFWEMEDARLAYGLMPVGPTDLAQMMVIQYAGSYGNDWFVVPLELPVGTLTRLDSLVVTDTFGLRYLLPPLGAGAPAHWSMWQQGHRRRVGGVPIGVPATNLFFLPPTLGDVLDGVALEDVLFMRDEMTNVAWAIERTIESPIERPLQRAESDAPADEAPPGSASSPGTPGYRLATKVPAHWVPLLPVQLMEGTTRVSRLKRGAVLHPDGRVRAQPALGEVLNTLRDGLLHDEEVPREGVHVTRRRRWARWIDGSTWLWTALRCGIGRGEGSAGLRFDRIDDGAPPAG